jgi:hypothetical protein
VAVIVEQRFLGIVVVLVVLILVFFFVRLGILFRIGLQHGWRVGKLRLQHGRRCLIRYLSNQPARYPPGWFCFETTMS